MVSSAYIIILHWLTTRSKTNFDNCYVQNKNINLLPMLFSLKDEALPNVEITYKFPDRGHSLLPTDGVFGRIDQDLKSKGMILMPADYITMLKKHGNVHVYGLDWICYDFKSAASLHTKSRRQFKISAAKVIEINDNKLCIRVTYAGVYSYHSTITPGMK